MKPRRSSVPFLPLLAAICLATVGCEGAADGGQPPFDPARLESVEDLTESLANDLLAFSVAARQRDADSIRAFVADRVAGPALPDPGEPHDVVKWIGSRPWPLGEGETTRDGTSFVDELLEWFSHYASIEDARFKVVSATIDPADPGRASADVKCFVVGRNAGGDREWLKGRVDASFTRGDDRWQFVRFVPTRMGSKIASVELFSDVTRPAGLAAVYPPFGVGANEGFISHGAAVADVDLDGLLDLAVSGVERNRLYRNRGDGRFDEIGGTTLVAAAPTGSGVLFLDYDNDGDSDLFMAAVGRQILLENRIVPEGTLWFRDVSDSAGIDRAAVGFSAVAADVDGNGFPDIYVASYNRYGTVMPDSWIRATNGTTNLLFLNRGDGTFEEAGARLGVDDGRWSYAAAFIDIDGDADQDLYVANDFGENAFYRNDGERFTDVAAELGLVDQGFGMGVSFGDYDNDGDFDLHVTNMSSTAGKRILSLLYPEGNEIRDSLGKQAAGNSLYRNDGDGRFSDATDDVGGLSGGWAFGGGFFDFDNDGWDDLYSPNGFVSGKSMKDT